MKVDSLALKAYTEIRKKILSQQLTANTRLKEDDWAGKIDVSRMAIREALNRLLGEGLLSVGEKGGYYVKPITLADINQIRELREILEIGALKISSQKMTLADISQLEAICDDFSLMVKQGYYNGACEADIKFHETLIKCARNDKLTLLYQSSHIPLFHEKLGRALTEIDDYALTDKEHRLIVKALKEKKLELAEQTMLGHFERGVSVVLSL